MYLSRVLPPLWFLSNKWRLCVCFVDCVERRYRNLIIDHRAICIRLLSEQTIAGAADFCAVLSQTGGSPPETFQLGCPVHLACPCPALPSQGGLCPPFHCLAFPLFGFPVELFPRFAAHTRAHLEPGLFAVWSSCFWRAVSMSPSPVVAWRGVSDCVLHLCVVSVISCWFFPVLRYM